MSQRKRRRMKKILISFNEKQLDQLRNESEKLGSSIASIVRSATVKYFQQTGGEN